MKEKIKAALQQGHKNLGITDEEVFERAASAAETFITDEAKIPEFVEKAGPMLKLYQSEADKARTAKARVAELEAKLSDKNTPVNKEGEPGVQNPTNSIDVQKIIADAVAATTAANAKLVESLQDKITAFESAQTAKEAVINAQNEYRSNDYVKGYPDEANDAWERTLEINTERGGKMTSKELIEKAMGYFSKAVSRKGIDTTKPYEGNGNGDTFDVNKYRQTLERTGRIKTDKK
jgi:hypothetical protein